MIRELTTSGRPFHLGRRPELDGLRGVAIALVVLYHLKVHIAGHRIPSGGYFGVDIFLVLSGFLITSLLLEEWQRAGGISLRDFYARRALRLFPGLGLFLLVVLGYAWWLSDAHPARHGDAGDLVRAVIATATYSANWVDALHLFNHGLVGLGTTWSLALEEQFYLVWPLTLLALLRWTRTPRQALALTLLGVAATSALRLRLYEDGYPWYRLYFAPDTRADGLLLGCALGIIVAAGMLPGSARFRRALIALAWLALAVLAVLVLREQDPDRIGRMQLVAYPLAGIATATLMARLLVAPVGPLAAALRARPLTWLGRLSYGIYLWHLPLIVYLHPAFIAPRWMPVFQVGLTLACACASYYLVERRCLRLKTRFQRAEAPVVVAPAPAAVSLR